MVAMLQFFSTVVLFFVLDCAVVGSPLGWYVSLNRAFFYALILNKKPPYQYTIVGFFALMPTFVRTGIWGADLVCMVPLALMLRFIARVTHLSYLVKAFLVFVCLLAHAWLIGCLWEGLPWQRLSLFVIGFNALVALAVASIGARQ